MDNLTFMRANGDCILRKDAGSLRQLLAAYPELTRTATSREGVRMIDTQIRVVLTLVPDDEAAYELCKVYLEYGADINHSLFQQADCGAIKYAAERNLDLVKLFFHYGARINHDVYGKPASWPLLGAVCANRLDIVAFLIGHSAVINFVNVHRLSPLDYASQFPEMAAYLRSNGAKHAAELPQDHLPPPDAT